MSEPPNNLDAERAVLGAMLLKESAIDAVSGSLMSSDFYKPSHALIYHTIVDLRRSGSPSDAVTVVNAIEKQGLLQSLGDPTQFISLQANVPNTSAARHYAEIVLDCSLRRRMIAEASALMQQSSDMSVSAQDTLESHREMLATIGSSTIDGEPDDWAVEDFLAQYRERDPLTKWVVHGLIRKQHKLMIVGGESDGKSVLTRYIAICAAHGVQPFRHLKIRPVRTLIVDLENPSDAMCESFEMILKPVLKTSDMLDQDAISRLWWRPAGIDLRNRVDVAHFENIIRRRRPELICFGPMYQSFAMKPGEPWETPAREVQRALKQLMVRYDFAMVLEDHAPQADSSGKRPMRPYGSSFWRRWLDIGIGMEPIGTSRTGFELNQWKKRVGTDWPKFLERGDVTGSPWPWVARWE